MPEIPQSAHAERPEQPSRTNEQLLDELTLLRDGEFTVSRSDDSQETGWSIAGVTVNRETGKLMVSLVNPEQKLRKVKSAEEVLSWQSPEIHTLTLTEGIARDVGSQAIEASGVIDATAERRHAAHLRQIFTLPDPDSVDRYGNSMRERATVTPLSEKEAEVVVRYAVEDRSELGAIYRKYEQMTGLWREEDMPRLLRENPDMRVEVGAYLLEKIADMPHLPERVARNAADNLKNPNFPGYDRKLTSKEYAVVLALAMLDGTFKSSHNRHDTIEKNTYQEVEAGQHRYAAYMVLGIERDIDTIKRTAESLT